MGLYVNGQKDHSNSILTFSVENGRNLGDVVNSHPGWEILLGGKPNLRGLAIGLSSKTYALDRVGGLVYNAEEPHHEYFHEKELNSEAVVIRQEFLQAFLGEILDTRSIRFTPVISPDSSFLENVRQTYLSLRGGLLEKQHAKAATESLVIDLLERNSHNKKEVLRRLKLSSPRMLLKEILTEIHQSAFDEDLNLPRLADRLGVTQFHIIRTVKSALGYTPYTYIRRLRLERAQLLLRQTKLPITRIALDCGFSDTSTFNKAFKSWKGIPPSKFRNSIG